MCEHCVLPCFSRQMCYLQHNFMSQDGLFFLCSYSYKDLFMTLSALYSSDLWILLGEPGDSGICMSCMLAMLNFLVTVSSEATESLGMSSWCNGVDGSKSTDTDCRRGWSKDNEREWYEIMSVLWYPLIEFMECSLPSIGTTDDMFDTL